MASQSFQQTIARQIAAGALLNTYTTAKSVINPQALATIPPNYLEPGKLLRLTVHGAISNLITAQPTFTFQVMMGSIVVHTSGAILTTNVAHTLIPFTYEALLRVDSVGSGTSAKLLAQGKLTGMMFVVSGNVADPTSGAGVIMCPNTAPAVGTGFDSTIANILDFWVGISASNSGNGVQIYNYLVEDLSV
jgi:hypothetical protein